MDEINKALKDIVLKFLLWVKEGLSWKLMITLLILYVSWETGNREGGTSALLAAIISVITGGTYVVTKTIQNRQIIKNGLNKPEVSSDLSKSKLLKEIAVETASREFEPSIPTPFFFEPPSSMGTLTAGVDWLEFWNQVDAEQARLIKELPIGEKGEKFSRYEAIMNVGRRFPVDNLDDLTAYAAALYESTLKWFKEVAGFDYWDAKMEGVPAKLVGRCGCENLDAWIVANMQVKPAAQGVKYSISRCNDLANLQDGWQASFPDFNRTLFYVYQNAARQ